MVLDEATSKYVVRVRRLRRGDALILFDPETALEASATLLEDSPQRCRVESAAPQPSCAGSGTELVLVQGAGKGEKLDLVVRDATALGVTRLVVLEAERSVRRLAASPGDKLQRWRRISVEAARQCGRGDTPRLEFATNLVDVVAALHPQVRVWMLDPRGEAHLAELLLGTGPATALAICVGPEGGWSPHEVDGARGRGGLLVRAWPHVLRTETAATAALGAISALRGITTAPR